MLSSTQMMELTMFYGNAPQKIQTFSRKNSRKFHPHTLQMVITELPLLTMLANLEEKLLKPTVKRLKEKSHFCTLWLFTILRAT
jgi:hypothetical protein